MHFGAPLPPNPIEEIERNKKMNEKKLKGKELYELKKKEKIQSKKKDFRKEKLSKAPKKIGKAVSYFLFFGAVIAGISWIIVSRPKLPPTISQGHIESSPEAHIVTEPIPDNIQRHMLEHADGGGPPGIIIQYNCNGFVCEPNLVEKLTELASRYPQNVYLAPNSYDGKIILTKTGRRSVLNEFNEEEIRKFIGG